MSLKEKVVPVVHDDHYRVLCDWTEKGPSNTLTILHRGEVVGTVARSKWLKWLDDTAVNNYQVSGFWVLVESFRQQCIDLAASSYIYQV